MCYLVRRRSSLLSSIGCNVVVIFDAFAIVVFACFFFVALCCCCCCCRSAAITTTTKRVVLLFNLQSGHLFALQSFLLLQKATIRREKRRVV